MMYGSVWVKTETKQSFCMPDSLGVGVKVVRTARVPMGGWAEETPSALRHHETLPEESSEDEMPPHVHRVKPLCGKAEFWLKIYKFAALKSFLFPLLSSRCHNKAMVNQGLNHAFGSLTAHLHAFVDSFQDWPWMKMDTYKKKHRLNHLYRIQLMLAKNTLIYIEITKQKNRPSKFAYKETTFKIKFVKF